MNGLVPDIICDLRIKKKFLLFHDFLAPCTKEQSIAFSIHYAYKRLILILFNLISVWGTVISKWLEAQLLCVLNTWSAQLNKMYCFSLMVRKPQQNHVVASSFVPNTRHMAEMAWINLGVHSFAVKYMHLSTLVTCLTDMSVFCYNTHSFLWKHVNYLLCIFWPMGCLQYV